MLASVPGLPRYAIYCARLIVRGRETLKTGKAWDETSRAHRRWVDAGSRAPRCLNHNRIHSRAFDALTVRVGVSLDCRATCSCPARSLAVERSRVYTYLRSRQRGARNPARLWARDVSSQAFPVFNVHSPAQLNARNKSRNGEGLGPRLQLCIIHDDCAVLQPLSSCRSATTVSCYSYSQIYTCAIALIGAAPLPGQT